MVTEPDFWPVVAGVKDTVIEHAPLGKTMPGHVLVWLKPTPVAAMPLIIKGRNPVFCKLTFVVAVELRATLPKEILFVESETV